MASYKVCEHGEYNPPRCRKRATVAIGYRVLFASRVNMRGPDEKIYNTRITFRCPKHKEIAGKVGELEIGEYLTKLAELEKEERDGDGKRR